MTNVVTFGGIHKPSLKSKFEIFSQIRGYIKSNFILNLAHYDVTNVISCLEYDVGPVPEV